MKNKLSPFQINLESLKDGSEKEFTEVLTPAFFDVEEGDDIAFKKEGFCKGRVYLAEEYLIVEMDVSVEVEVPCAFCNESFSIEITITQWRHEELISSIKNGVFDYGVALREAILLEIPFYPLCGGKVCSNRKEIEQFCKKKSPEEENKGEYRPFLDLQI